MGNRKNIDKFSIKYWLTRYFWGKRVHSLYYRKIESQNLSRIPAHEPVILAPNHQNALMDAMALVSQLPSQTVFMARADIFKSSFAERLLTFMKILPIYRIRDGIASLGKNEELFELTAQILHNKINPLCLFPEGNHGDKRRLRPLVKGIFRIAFRAQSSYGNKPGVKIIPVGLDYEHYQKFRKTLFLNIGEPIEVSEYWDSYVKDPALAINQLRDRLSDEMRKVMIDIQTEEYYNTYMGLKTFFRKNMMQKLGLVKKSLANQFVADKALIGKLDECLQQNPEKIKQIDELFNRYAFLRDRLKLRDWVFRKEKYPVLLNSVNLFLLILAIPVYLWGLITNWPHFYIPVRFFRKIKDKQFQSTAMWGMGIAIQAVYYIIISIIAVIYIPWWVALIFIVTLAYSGILALSIRNAIIKTWAKIRYSCRQKNTDIIEAKDTYKQIVRLLDTIV
jgi:1-acyl-sn-glycerol-3-phosphate acyltransferase